MTDTDHTREALALRHVFQQPTDDRADMLVKLEESHNILVHTLLL